jgi:uncharacterized protein with PIN domain
MTTLLSRTERKAAHAFHVCGLCNSHIERSERYLDERFVDDGCAYTMRSHLECDRRYWAARHGWGLYEDDCLSWEGVLEYEAEQEGTR